MLPREETIFNIGGGEGGEEAYNTMAAIGTVAPEGLRIAIQHHHGRRGISNNIVTKTMLKPPLRSTTGGLSRRRPVKSLPEHGFLRTCLFCLRELSLQKEVYMYRGDQGFCSVECRYKQILLDERREFEVTYKRESATASRNFRGSSTTGESDRRRRISAA